jgi:CheY-like chemotaxis protein
VARTVRGDQSIRDTPLVIVSAHVRPEEITLPVGTVDAVLAKPVRPDTLFAVIQNAVARSERGVTTTTSVKPRVQGKFSTGRGGRVLIVEDNAVNQKLAAKVLEKMGCNVDVAANGLEAVQMIRQIPFDLVFMDCQMPVMDGYQATAEIRTFEGVGRRVPIVAMTAHAMQGDKEKCLKAGMDDYIAKPINLDEVKAALTRWLPIAGVKRATKSMDYMTATEPVPV